MEEDKLRKIQLCEFRVLIEIDNICKKHNIKYFLSYGTLLGAIRHSGFIPWDDDLDIGMDIHNYNKFLKIINDELTQEFEIITTNMDETPKKYLLYGTKIALREIPQIGVDIIPFSYLSNNTVYRKFQLITNRIYTDTHWHYRDPEIDKYTNGIIRTIYYKGVITIIGDMAKNSTIHKYFRSYLKIIYRDISKKSNWIKGIVYSEIKSEQIERITYVPFEGLRLPVPSGYHEILQKWYGDYMIPKMTHTHLQEYPLLGKYEKYNTVEDVLNEIKNW